MPSVLAAARDPGGAEALLPVLEALSKGGNGVTAVAQEPAYGRFSGSGIASSRIEGRWPELVRHAEGTIREATPDVVVLATSMGPGIEVAILRAARARRVPVVVVLDSWTNYTTRFLAPNEPRLGPEALPDLLTVMDEFAAAELESEGFTPSILRVVGQPAFDAWVVRSRSDDWQRERQRVRDALDVPSGDSLIVFFSQPIADLYGPRGSPAYRGYDERDALGALLDAMPAIGARTRLVVKPHPSENAGAFAWLQPHAGSRVRVVTSMSAEELTAASDLVASMTSTTLVQAMLVGRPTISVQPHLKVPDALILGRMGLLEPVTDPGALAGAIRTRLTESGDATVSRLPLWWRDGGATQRVSDLVSGLTASADK